MEKETAIKQISTALYENRCAFFIGSGISIPSTNLNWGALVEPFFEELRITFDEEPTDLPKIAQYIINHYSGNRGPLLRSISNALNKEFPTNTYHKYISTTKVNTIWTTNYDTLLEQSFSDFLIDVKVNDDAISRNIINSELEIIKLHGCISRSNFKDIVITQEDYEDFENNKPAMVQRLTNDLLKKSFLFIGYSYNDPNIHNIMVMARRLASKATQQHFIILERPKKSDEYKKRIFELWTKDLSRLGLSVILIDDFSELEELLHFISQKSRGNTVYVTGSHEKSPDILKELGSKLAKKDDIVLINGQSSGIGIGILNSFIQECINKKQDISSRLQIFPNPYAANPAFSNDPSLLGDLKKSRAKLLSATQLVLCFPGGMGTEAEIDVAKSRNCRIIPVLTDVESKTNHAIRKLIDDKEVMKMVRNVDSDYETKLKDGSITSCNDIINCVNKMLQ